MNPIIISIIGICGLLFRIWICEFRLKNLLEFRRRYLSRFIAYYYFIGMAFAWKVTFFNIIIIGAMPTMIFSIIFLDFPFFWKFLQKENRVPGNNSWLIIERLTMHIPCVITGIWWLIEHFTLIYTPFSRLTYFIISLIAIIITFMLFDKRWTEEFEPPRGIFVLIAILGSFLRFYIYFTILK